MYGLLLSSEFRKMHRDSVKAELIVDNVITSQEELEFRGFMVIPGGKDDYCIRLTPVAGVIADLSIDFDEIKDETQATAAYKLKDYARVKIYVEPTGGEKQEVMDGLLADVFEGEVYKQKIKLIERRAFYVYVEFYLPVEVGNEVKNLTSDFYITIKVEKTKIEG